jgi:hypothetical protein
VGHLYDGDTGLHGTRAVIEKTPLVPNQYINLPDHVTVAVQTTDGRHFTQDAYVDKRFDGQVGQRG